MALFNLGKKDRHGRQQRIEHRGRLLRASRTGGVALRAQTQAAGIQITGNTNRGVRLSATPAKNTQIALQNGRFILRGRYGSGPTRLNVSKSGMTISTRNRIGSFNWVKPKRSSAKIGGVQFRGRNALVLQAGYAVAATISLLIQTALALLKIGVQIAIGVMFMVVRVFSATPLAIRALKRRLLNRQLRRACRQLNPELLAALNVADNAVLRAASGLILACWGRGTSVRNSQASAIMQNLTNETEANASSAQQARILLSTIERSESNPRLWHLAYLANIAATLRDRLSANSCAQLLLDMDEQIVARAPRTVLQEQMLAVFADFAELRLELTPDTPESTRGSEPTTAPHTHPDQPGLIDLNTANLETLQNIPHIGPERAEALLELRPIHRLEQLCAIDGIGPARLAEIKAFGVTLKSTKAG